jgi:hypothetical protein
MSPDEKYKAVAGLFDQRYGTHMANMTMATEGEADAAYLQLRAQLYPSWKQWENALQRTLDQRLMSASVAGTRAD